MRRFFAKDGTLVHLFYGFLNLMLLNLMTLAFCLPIVTAGGAISAMFYTLRQLKEVETRELMSIFWKSFRQNFVQGAGVFLSYLVFFLGTIWGISQLKGMGSTGASYAAYALVLLCLFAAASAVWVFQIQSRYINLVFVTIKNAFMLWGAYPLRTLLMLALFAGAVLLAVLPYMQLPALLLGLTAPGGLSVLISKKAFQEVESLYQEEANSPT